MYFITGNKNKFAEAKAIIPELEMLELDLPEIQSDNAEDIIRAKLDEAMKTQHGEFIVEDTSLHLDALNGLPGPLIKWFLKNLGPQGIYELADAKKNYHAKARCLIGYSTSGKIQFFEGVVEGTIVAPRGESKFGWDPIFEPKGHHKTFAEMTKEEKNRISHRKIALTKLADQL